MLRAPALPGLPDPAPVPGALAAAPGPELATAERASSRGDTHRSHGRPLPLAETFVAGPVPGVVRGAGPAPSGGVARGQRGASSPPSARRGAALRIALPLFDR